MELHTYFHTVTVHREEIGPFWSLNGTVVLITQSHHCGMMTILTDSEVGTSTKLSKVRFINTMLYTSDDMDRCHIVKMPS